MRRPVWLRAHNITMNPYPITLVIDSSTPTLFLGLLRGHQPLGDDVVPLARQQSEQMMPRLVALMARYHLTLADIEVIVVGEGPGSFTGVRLSLTLVKTLALIQPIQVYAISSLQLCAFSPFSAVWMDARGGRMYVGIYRQHQSILAPAIYLQSDQTALASKYEGSQWVTPEQAFADPRSILAHVVFMLPHLQPIKDVQLLNPRYLKELG